MRPVKTWLQRALWEKVPRDQQDAPEALRRRQVVTGLVILLGGTVLGLSLRIEPGNPWFYPATLLLALVWTVGAFVSGPLHLGRVAHGDGVRRPVLAPILLGAALVGLFSVGALLIREISALSFLVDEIREVLELANQGTLWIIVIVTALNGIAEELFFRGAAYAAIPRHPIVWTTVGYTVATLATGNVMLAFAAVLLGLVVGLQRRASGGILGPILTHLTWSLSMLFLLPLIFSAPL